MGAVLALTVQGESATRLIGILENGYEPQTGVPRLDELLLGGGLKSMYGTIGLILCALAFGGLMERTGMLRVIVDAVMRAAINTGRDAFFDGA